MAALMSPWDAKEKEGRVTGAVLVLKWDALYGRLLGDAVRVVFPLARVAVERAAADVRRRVAVECHDLVILGLSLADDDGLPLLQDLAASGRGACVVDGDVAARCARGGVSATDSRGVGL